MDFSAQNQLFNWRKSWSRHKIQLILAVFGLLLLIGGIFSAFYYQANSQSSEIEIISSVDEDPNREIYIDVSGAVERPGLYQLKTGSRINDALISAGGLSAEADREWFSQSVNLAQTLVDGQKIFIPAKTENTSQTAVLSNQTLSQLKININTASLTELDTLPGIGPVYGQKIIDGRPYTAIEELINVSGIGESLFEKIKDKICVY